MPATPLSAADLAALPFSPAAERNAQPILAALVARLPQRACVLEVASGTGQHGACFAAAQPGWTWQPSEAASAALPAVAARCAGLPAVQAPLLLDVTAAPWPCATAAFDAVYTANLLHIAPWATTGALMAGSALCLKPGGLLLVYGPFVVQGEPLAQSNAAFDADLRARNPAWGLRALQAVVQAAAASSFTFAERLPMPANNQLLCFRLGVETSA